MVTSCSLAAVAVIVVSLSNAAVVQIGDGQQSPGAHEGAALEQGTEGVHNPVSTSNDGELSSPAAVGSGKPPSPPSTSRNRKSRPAAASSETVGTSNQRSQQQDDVAQTAATDREPETNPRQATGEAQQASSPLSRRRPEQEQQQQQQQQAEEQERQQQQEPAAASGSEKGKPEGREMDDIQVEYEEENDGGLEDIGYDVDNEVNDFNHLSANHFDFNDDDPDKFEVASEVRIINTKPKAKAKPRKKTKAKRLSVSKSARKRTAAASRRSRRRRPVESQRPAASAEPARMLAGERSRQSPRSSLNKALHKYDDGFKRRHFGNQLSDRRPSKSSRADDDDDDQSKLQQVLTKLEQTDDARRYPVIAPGLDAESAGGADDDDYEQDQTVDNRFQATVSLVLPQPDSRTYISEGVEYQLVPEVIAAYQPPHRVVVEQSVHTNEIPHPSPSPPQFSSLHGSSPNYQRHHQQQPQQQLVLHPGGYYQTEIVSKPIASSDIIFEKVNSGQSLMSVGDDGMKYHHQQHHPIVVQEQRPPPPQVVFLRQAVENVNNHAAPAEWIRVENLNPNIVTVEPQQIAVNHYGNLQHRKRRQLNKLETERRQADNFISVPDKSDDWKPSKPDEKLPNNQVTGRKRANDDDDDDDERDDNSEKSEEEARDSRGAGQRQRDSHTDNRKSASNGNQLQRLKLKNIKQKSKTAASKSNRVSGSQRKEINNKERDDDDDDDEEEK